MNPVIVKEFLSRIRNLVVRFQEDGFPEIVHECVSVLQTFRFTFTIVLRQKKRGEKMSRNFQLTAKIIIDFSRSFLT